MSDVKRIGGAFTFQDLFRWAAVLFQSPRDFFRGMERKGGFAVPCLYVLWWSFISSFVGFLVALLRGGRLVQAAGVILGPPVVVGLGFLMAGLLFVVWHLMGSKEDYETAFRCWAFMAPLGAVGSALGIIPFLPLLVFAYTFYLVVLATQEVHGIPSRRAWLVWGSLAGACFAILLVLLAVGAVIQSRGGPGAFSSSTVRP